VQRAFLIIAGAVGLTVTALITVSIYQRFMQGAFLAHPPEHGASFVFEIDPAKLKEDPTIQSAIKETMRRRASRLGVRVYWEPISQTQFRVSARISANDAADFAKALSRGGALELRIVHAESDDFIKQGLVLPGYTLLSNVVSMPDGRRQIETLLVKRKPEPGLSGNLVKNAWVDRDRFGQPQIMFEMTPVAAAAFANVTRDNIGQRLAIVMDGELVSAPKIRSPIENGIGMITADFRPQDASAIANAMQSTLPAPIKALETKAF
jgi:preprotein translocase subunit SecD